MADPIMKRQVTALIGRCYAGLGVAELRDEVLRRLRRIMSVDAAFFGTVDPQTLLFTSAVAEEPLGAATPLFLDNEYGRRDVNKFAALAEAADPVGSLDRATRGQRPDSARYREVMSPLGLGDELRAVLISGKQCWGAICLHREDAEHGFYDREVDVIRRIAPHVAEGLRRAVTLGSLRAPAESTAAVGAPGIILLDQDLALMSMSPEAAQWLAEIDEADWPSGSELPMAVYGAAARLARLEQGTAPPQLADTIRLRSRAGQWLSLHASRLGGGPSPQIGIVVEPTPAAQISSLLLSAYGLTGAQSRVVALVIRGHSTRQIVEELHISANTVQEHLTAAFDKFGVRSRRELVAAMLTGRPAAP
jgi:DNA-binding CsgD family transcriptional regulator